MLSKVYGRNFQSWPEFEFPITPGVTLIDGWNADDQTSEGSGKSSIVNAISWNYYGQIPKDANIDEVIMFGQKSCIVVSEFSNGDIIVRSRGPNDLYLKLANGKIIKGATAKETQLLIEEYIGSNFETFCQSVYFAQNYAKKFLTSNQEDKGKILSNIQNLAVFDKAVKETQALLKLEKEKIQGLVNSLELDKNNANHLLSKIDMLDRFINQKIEQFNYQKQKHEENHDALTVDLAKKMDTLISIQNSKEELVQRLGVNPNALTELEQTKNELGLRLHEIKTAKTQVDSINRNIQLKNLDGTKYANQYAKLQDKKVKLELFIQNPSSTCPTCGSTMANVDVTHNIKELEDINLEMTDLLGRLTEISNFLELNKPVSNESLTQEESGIQSQITQIMVHINNIKSSEKLSEQLTSQLIYAQAAIENSEKSLKESRDKYALLVAPDTSREEAEKQTLAAESVKLREAFDSKSAILDASKTYAARLEVLKDGFKEIKSYVFNNALNELNFRTNQYLQQLFEVNASIKFTNDDQKIESSIVVGSNKTSLGLLSGGQHRRFNLAVDLALADLVNSRKINKVNLLVLDEYFKDLSEVSMEKCLAILKNRKSPVILIEHNSLFKSIVDNTYNVWYENGQSSIK